MAKKINRRSFLKQSAALGAASVLGQTILSFPARGEGKVLFGAEGVDISEVSGENYFKNTVESIEMLGGMKKFVSKDAKVAVLINSAFRNPGTIVNPDVALAVVDMCANAGAKEICCLCGETDSYWRKSRFYEKFKKQLKSLTSPAGHVSIKIPKAKKLKEVAILETLLDYDVFIDVPIVKNHAGTNFTGTLKNLMGATSPSNRFFHYGSNPNARGAYEDVAFLSQCIADLNLVRKPDLCVVDATEFIVTNGPFGPGKLVKPRKVIAGIDSVAIDSYCAGLLDLEAKDVAMIRMAHEHGLGEIDSSKLNIRKAAV